MSRRSESGIVDDVSHLANFYIIDRIIVFVQKFKEVELKYHTLSIFRSKVGPLKNCITK